MGEPAPHEWEIILLQPVQGFRKSFEVEAPYVQDAVDMAFDKLSGQGYDPDKFVTISAVRGREVGR